jgi:hypothetical protein
MNGPLDGRNMIVKDILVANMTATRKKICHIEDTSQVTDIRDADRLPHLRLVRDHGTLALTEMKQSAHIKNDPALITTCHIARNSNHEKGQIKPSDALQHRTMIPIPSKQSLALSHQAYSQ